MFQAICRWDLVSLQGILSEFDVVEFLILSVGVCCGCVMSDFSFSSGIFEIIFNLKFDNLQKSGVIE